MTHDEFYQKVAEMVGQVESNQNHPELSEMFCNEHGLPMEKKFSEKKQKNYWCHRNEDGQICFGKGYLAS